MSITLVDISEDCLKMGRNYRDENISVESVCSLIWGEHSFQDKNVLNSDKSTYVEAVVSETLEKETLEKETLEKETLEKETLEKETLEEVNPLCNITDEDSSQYSFFPIKYHILESYYQKQKDMVWTAQEIDYLGDRSDWDRLDKDSKTFIKFVLFFFAQTDGILCVNLSNFKAETSMYKEAGYFYAAQEFMEVTHNETYSMLIEALIRDPVEKHKAFNAIKYYPSIGNIANWMFKWMDNSIPLAERVIAFACIEGILFSSAFAAIYWIKRKNILHGLCQANFFIARDEALHTEFAVALYHVMTGIDKKFESVSEKRVHEIISSSVKIAEDFTRDALKVELIGMNSDDMISYIKCTANRLSESFGYKKIYDVENPFDWMLVIGLPNKSNFFESKPTEYARQCASEFNFDLELDF
jgi:ribonucleoside-diphosphate reductase subunit M2